MTQRSTTPLSVANEAATPATDRKKMAGFTLLELLIAGAIFATIIGQMIHLRLEAIERVRDSTETRLLQRLAQEKLDEAMYSLEPMLDGDFEEHKNITWTLEPHEIAGSNRQEGEDPLIECTITLTYNVDERNEPREYVLSSWFFPKLGHWIRDELGIDDEFEEDLGY